MTTAEFYEHLTALGVGIFTAPPGGNEFHRPSRWQDTDSGDNASRLAKAGPSDALCGVMGGKVAVVDVDTKNGADVEQVQQLLDGIGCRIYADVLTPSRGRHFYVAGHRDLPTVAAQSGRDGLTGLPGVEVASWGHNVFLPGTRRPKYDGTGYVILADELDVLVDGGDPDSADALAGWVADHRATDSRPDFEVSVPWSGAAPDRRQQAYLDAVLRNRAERIAGMGRDTGRNVAVYEAGLSCGNYVAGAGMDQQAAEDTILEAATRSGLVAEDGQASVLASFRSGLRNGIVRPRAVPDGPSDGAVHTVDTLDHADDREPPAGRADDPDAPRRQLVLTSAASIKPRRVLWMWHERIALGTLALLAGREGLGKSTVAYWIVAQVTRGALPGEFEGQPRAALICATEDSWEHTIVPRLMAAGADLEMVFRVDVLTSEGVHSELSMPRDLHQMEETAKATGAALLLLDPLMSRLDGRLDTHKDAEVRLALEPLTKAADSAALAVLGLIHHNKSASTDPLQLVMASKAFTAVARSVSTVIPDPDDDSETRRLFGTPKNNLGRDDLPALAFTIGSHAVDTDDGPAWTGKVAWGSESKTSIREAMQASHDTGDKTATQEAAEWLQDYLEMHGGVVASADAKKAGKGAGHSQDALKRASRRLDVEVESSGFPRRTYWSLPSRSSDSASRSSQSEQTARGEYLTALTAPTEGYLPQSAQLVQSEQAPVRDAPTAAPPGEYKDCPACAQPLSEPAPTCSANRFHGRGAA